MQRLHEDDLVGHVLAQEPWEVVCFPAIADADEVHRIETIWGPRCFRRCQGEALHPDREPLETLDHIRQALLSTRTTQLYDRRRDEVSLDELERIVI